MAMVQLASYAFGTVENPLSDGGSFATMASYGNLAVTVSGICHSVVAATNSNEFWQGTGGISADGNWANDQYSEVKLGTVTSSIGPMVRTKAAQGYLAAITPGAAAGGTFFKLTGSGGYSSIGTWTGTTAASNDVWRLQIIGTTLTVFQNGVSKGTATDSTYASGNPALYSSSTTGLMTLWAAGANQAATPTFSPVAGIYIGTQTITITSASGGTIYYTTDGTTPTHASSSIVSGGTISLAASATVNAIASVTDFADSAVGSAAYTITPASSGGQTGLQLAMDASLRNSGLRH